LPSSAANPAAERDDFAPYVSKSVPQRLKPSSAQAVYGTAKPVPFVRQSSPTSEVSEGFMC
jgi:hypothetical protein